MNRIAIAAAALAAASAGIAFAQQGPKPEDEIRYRQSVMNVIGRAMGPMGAMAQGKAPFNAAVAQKNSALVESLIALPYNSFGPGTDKGAPTKADPKIWTESAKFKQIRRGRAEGRGQPRRHREGRRRGEVQGRVRRGRRRRARAATTTSARRNSATDQA